MLQQFNVIIPAGQGTHNKFSGKVLSVKTCSLPINVSFDGGGYQPVQAGSVVPTAGFTVLNFQNPNNVNVTITYYVGDESAPFSPQDNSASNAPTYPVGNLGIANGTAAAGGNPQCNGAGLLQITAGMALVIPNTDPVTGHRRQTIYFSVDPAAAYNLAILDPAGNTFMTLGKGAIINLTLDGPLKISGIGGTVGVTIGQTFLLNN